MGRYLYNIWLIFIKSLPYFVLPAKCFQKQCNTRNSARLKHSCVLDFLGRNCSLIPGLDIILSLVINAKTQNTKYQISQINFSSHQKNRNGEQILVLNLCKTLFLICAFKTKTHKVRLFNKENKNDILFCPFQHLVQWQFYSSLVYALRMPQSFSTFILRTVIKI